MRRPIFVAGIAVVLCALFTINVSGEVLVNRLTMYDQPWFIKCESALVEFSGLRWSPDKGDEKEFEQRLGGPALTSGQQDITRKISWRLDSGQIGDFDWTKVKKQLLDNYNIQIGKIVEVTIPAVKPIMCYCVNGVGYAAYSREVFEIVQVYTKPDDGKEFEQRSGGPALSSPGQILKTAVVSILRPIDGIAIEFDDCMCLDGYDFCVGCAPPQSMRGTYASAMTVPHCNNNCNEVGTGSKLDPNKQLLFTEDDTVVKSTWGTIKELYRND